MMTTVHCGGDLFTLTCIKGAFGIIQNKPGSCDLIHLCPPDQAKVRVNYGLGDVCCCNGRGN